MFIRRSKPERLAAFSSLGSSSGFTLIELMVAMSVLAVTVLVSLGFIFSVRDKAILTRDIDQLAATLDFARQQSILAYKGHAYSLIVDPAGTYRVDPGERNFKLYKNTKFTDLTYPVTITFNKLTGTTQNPTEFSLTRAGLVGTITIDSSGSITKSDITTQ